MKQLKDIVAEFNIVARTEYVRTYESYIPKFKEGLMFSYNSGLVESVRFPIVGFIQAMEKWTGSRQHKLMPKSDKFIISNEKWDLAVDILKEDFERSAGAQNILGLDLYKRRIADMAVQVKNHPVSLGITLLENGASSTFGTSFDSQNFFSTTHNFAVATAGTQSNIVTGTGTALTNIVDDLVSALARFGTFFDPTATDPYNKKLNRGMMPKILVIAPVQLEGVFWRLLNDTLIGQGGAGVTNPFKGNFDYLSVQFTDTNDYYVIRQDEDAMFRPFLHQIEVEAILDVPQPNDERLRELDILTYGARGRYNVSYGAWWKAIKITNV